MQNIILIHIPSFTTQLKIERSRHDATQSECPAQDERTRLCRGRSVGLFGPSKHELAFVFKVKNYWEKMESGGERGQVESTQKSIRITNLTRLVK